MDRLDPETIRERKTPEGEGGDDLLPCSNLPSSTGPTRDLGPGHEDKESWTVASRSETSPSTSFPRPRDEGPTRFPSDRPRKECHLDRPPTCPVHPPGHSPSQVTGARYVYRAFTGRTPGRVASKGPAPRSVAKTYLSRDPCPLRQVSLRREGWDGPGPGVKTPSLLAQPGLPSTK